jgi:hypothetical protein
MRKNSGSTITTMCYSSFYSDQQIIDRIVNDGYHVDCMDMIREHTILVSAIQAERAQVAAFLINRGADMDAGWTTPRHALKHAKPGIKAMLEKTVLEMSVGPVVEIKKTSCASI